MTVTREMIAAYADGELAGESLAEVEAAIAADPALRDEVDRHRALTAHLAAHFAPVLDQPVPDRLSALLEPKHGGGAEVVSFAAERQRRGLVPSLRRWAPIAGPALAASLVLTLWQPWQGGDAAGGYAGTRLAAALDTQLVASQAADAETRILLSFENDAGQYCRAYRAADSGGIACRDESGWRIERQLGLGAGQASEYRQAGSEAEILAAAQDMAIGGGLDAIAEAEAKAKGWR